LGLRQQRADANYFTVDGVSANFGVTRYLCRLTGGAPPALSASGGTNSLVAVEELNPPQFTHVPFRVFGGEQQPITSWLAGLPEKLTVSRHLTG